MSALFGNNRLYAITPTALRGQALLAGCEAALVAGIRILQYRPKHDDALEKYHTAEALLQRCVQYDAVLLMNDDMSLAANISGNGGRIGVHLGRSDGDVCTARQLLGETAIIGVTCGHDVSYAREAIVNGADYVSCGAIFASDSKPAAQVIGLDGLRRMREAVNAPLVAIGGIDATNIDAVFAAGADMVACINAIFAPINSIHDNIMRLQCQIGGNNRTLHTQGRR